MKEPLAPAEIAPLLDEAARSLRAGADDLRRINNQAHSLLQEALTEQRQLDRFLDELTYRAEYAPMGGGMAPSDRKRTELQALETRIEERIGRFGRAIGKLEGAMGQLDALVAYMERDPASEDSQRLNDMDVRVRLIQGLEEERSRLAREIHDGPAQVLANAIMGIEFCEASARALPELQTDLRKLKLGLREGLGEVRRFIFNLRPATLADAGLEATVRRFVEDFSTHFGIETDLQVAPLDGKLSADVETVVFRVVQEALHNVRKHARASRVQVMFARQRNQTFSLSVADNGNGFDVSEQSRRGTGGSGLISMRERAQLVGGTFTIESSPGYGTTVVLTVPGA